jgi:NDP-sugar pyrophosphorylase family protein
VLHLVGAGVRRVFLAVNYRADQIVAHFGDGSDFGCQIEYLEEDPDCPLGTAGALSLLPDSARHGSAPILVMNGDLVTQFSVAALCATHERTGAVVTMAASEYRHPVPFGVLELDGEVVRAVVEKPTEAWSINAGVYAVNPSLLERVVPGREYAMTELVAECLARGERVSAYGIGGDWLDVGTPHHLGEARGESA